MNRSEKQIITDADLRTAASKILRIPGEIKMIRPLKLEEEKAE